MAKEPIYQWYVLLYSVVSTHSCGSYNTFRATATWDMEELLGREKEIVEGDKLKVRMII